MPWRPKAHRPGGQASGAAREARPRQKTTERGYGWQWQKLREHYAASHPAICNWPGCGFAGTSSEMHLDHIVAREKGGTDDFDNLQWLCERHHSAKTVREDGGFGRARNMTRIVVCGAPGSGKSTYVQQHRQRGDVVWDYDAVAACLTGLPIHECPEELIGAMGTLRDSLAQWLALNSIKRNVWIIATRASVAKRLSGVIGGHVVYMETSKDECLRRLERDGRLTESVRRAVHEWYTLTDRHN